MRVPSHWSLRYIADRTLAAGYAATHPRAPWLTRQSIHIIEQRLAHEGRGFEWGAGRSTLWLAERLAELTSVEHAEVWRDKVAAELAHRRYAHVRVVFAAPEHEAYVGSINVAASKSLDFVLVDGVSELRDVCALAALPLLRVGGLLAIDDVHRYLPSPSRAPLALKPNASPLTEAWAEFRARVAGWPLEWTSDGVRDTAIWTRVS